jgi:hypothetical protein
VVVVGRNLITDNKVFMGLVRVSLLKWMVTFIVGGRAHGIAQINFLPTLKQHSSSSELKGTIN